MVFNNVLLRAKDPQRVPKFPDCSVSRHPCQQRSPAASGLTSTSLKQSLSCFF